MTDGERFQDFRDFILWQQEGLDIEKQHCLFINFGVNMNFQFTQIRRVILISSKISLKFPNFLVKFWINYLHIMTSFAVWPLRMKSASWIPSPTHNRIVIKYGILILLKENHQQREKRSRLTKLSVHWSLWVGNFLRNGHFKRFWRRLIKLGE